MSGRNGQRRKEENGRKEREKTDRIRKLCNQRDKIRQEATEIWEEFKKKALMKKNMEEEKKRTARQCQVAERREPSKWTNR